MSVRPTGLAVVGCGYVSDFYLAALADYPGLTVVGVHDRIAERAVRVAARYGTVAYDAAPDLLADERVAIVLNLTNPAEHADISLAALAAGKHVYSEKPLATSVADGLKIVETAEQSGLQVSCAPANLLGEAFQTVWRELRSGAVGNPHLVYAELDDGAVHLMDYLEWTNSTGSPWPYRDEFATGCTVEHSAYHLTALTAMFGPVRRVVADHATLMPDKLPAGESGPIGPDFVTATLTMASGVRVRLTCSVVAPRDRSLTVVGDGGVLRLDDCWDFGSAVTVREPAGRQHDYLHPERPVALARPFTYRKRYAAAHRMDFPRGVADLAAAIDQRRPPRLSARHALHVLEATIAMTAGEAVTDIASGFPQPEPLPWAA